MRPGPERAGVYFWVAAATGFFVLAGCGKKKAKTEPPSGKPSGFKLTADAARKWLPTSAKEAAYGIAGGPKVYTPDNLHELLNGGADMYVEAGMVALTHLRFEDKNKKAARCEAFLYLMKDPGKAAALLNKETDKNWRPLAVGDRGVEDGQGAQFVKGRFYVRIDAPPRAEGVHACPYKELAGKIAADPGLPWK